MATNNPAMCRQTAGRRPTLLRHRVNFGLCRVQTRAKVNLAEPQTAIKNPQWGVSVRLTVSVKPRHNKPLKKMKWWSRQEQLQEKKEKKCSHATFAFLNLPLLVVEWFRDSVVVERRRVMTGCRFDFTVFLFHRPKMELKGFLSFTLLHSFGFNNPSESKKTKQNNPINKEVTCWTLSQAPCCVFF